MNGYYSHPRTIMRGQRNICNHHHRHFVQLHHGSIVVNWHFANIILDQAEKKKTLETGTGQRPLTINRTAATSCLTLRGPFTRSAYTDHHQHTIYLLLANAQDPRSRFSAGRCGLMSKSKISMGNPMVVHALGISTIPATCP